MRSKIAKWQTQIIPSEYYGWLRIIETSQWDNKYLGAVGTPMISFTGYDDRLRMLSLLAYGIASLLKQVCHLHGKVHGNTILSVEQEEWNSVKMGALVVESKSEAEMKVLLLLREQKNQEIQSQIHQVTVRNGGKKNEIAWVKTADR